MCHTMESYEQNVVTILQKKLILRVLQFRGSSHHMCQDCFLMSEIFSDGEQRKGKR